MKLLTTMLFAVLFFSCSHFKSSDFHKKKYLNLKPFPNVNHNAPTSASELLPEKVNLEPFQKDFQAIENKMKAVDEPVETASNHLPFKKTETHDESPSDHAFPDYIPAEEDLKKEKGDLFEDEVEYKKFDRRFYISVSLAFGGGVLFYLAAALLGPVFLLPMLALFIASWLFAIAAISTRHKMPDEVKAENDYRVRYNILLGWAILGGILLALLIAIFFSF